MTATPMYQNGSAITALNAILGSLNVGGIAGRISVWSGMIPVSCETADDTNAAHELSTLPLSTTAFPTAVDNSAGGATATANAITTDTNCANTGTAGYFRAYCSGSGAGSGGAQGCVIQGNVGIAATDMILATVSIIGGGTLAIASWTVTMPDGSGVD